MRILIAVLFALSSQAALAEEVYRWVDEKGRVHYGDTTKRPAERLRVQPDSGTGLDPEMLRDAQARAQECQRRRAQLETYRKADAIRETDVLGRTRELTGEERQQLIAQTEAQVSEICSEPSPAQAQAGTPPPAGAE
jgi:hypothetical protein